MVERQSFQCRDREKDVRKKISPNLQLYFNRKRYYRAHDNDPIRLKNRPISRLERQVMHAVAIELSSEKKPAQATSGRNCLTDARSGCRVR